MKSCCQLAAGEHFWALLEYGPNEVRFIHRRTECACKMKNVLYKIAWCELRCISRYSFIERWRDAKPERSFNYQMLQMVVKSVEWGGTHLEMYAFIVYFPFCRRRNDINEKYAIIGFAYWLQIIRCLIESYFIYFFEKKKCWNKFSNFQNVKQKKLNLTT